LLLGPLLSPPDHYSALCKSLLGLVNGYSAHYSAFQFITWPSIRHYSANMHCYSAHSSCYSALCKSLLGLLNHYSVHYLAFQITTWPCISHYSVNMVCYSAHNSHYSANSSHYLALCKSLLSLLNHYSAHYPAFQIITWPCISHYSVNMDCYLAHSSHYLAYSSHYLAYSSHYLALWK
jgi:hypothetical protein